MARPSKYSDKLWKKALNIYQEQGRAEASRQTGIPGSTIGERARRDGLKTKGAEKTRAATEARLEQLREQKTENAALFMERTKFLLDLMDKEQVDFKGQQADKVIYPRPPAQDLAALAKAAAISYDKALLGMGEPTSRGEFTGKDGAPLMPLSLTELAERAAARAKEAKDGSA